MSKKSKIATSPDRHTFQKEGYVKRCEEKGEEPNPAYIEMYKSWIEEEDAQVEDTAWQEYNLEYDLRSTDWVVEKCKNDNYAQNLYGAICNNQFAKFTQTGDRIETYRNLKEDYWSASWRSAGGIVANLRGEGDYIDWYCSGIGTNESGYGLDGYIPEIDADGREYVPEGVVTDEIRDDLAKLGWVGFPWKDEEG
jgi:hypothetical protein